MRWTPGTRPVLGPALGRLVTANSSGIVSAATASGKTFFLFLPSSFPLILFNFLGNFLNKITPQRPLILCEGFLKMLKQIQGKSSFGNDPRQAYTRIAFLGDYI